MNTNKGKHLTLEKRKIIKQYLSRGAKLVEIANALEMDPTTISKEIKRYRRPVNNKKQNDTKSKCRKLIKYPYVCDGCEQRYKCKIPHFTYIAQYAHSDYQHKLVNSRKSLSLDSSELEHLNEVIKEGVDNQCSIYHIVNSHDDIDVSVSTIYRYIQEGIIETKPIDLPRAVKYKKRKRYQKKYDYPKSDIDLEGHTFLDCLEFQFKHPNIFIVQMDFLGHIITDTKVILTLNISKLHFPLLFLLEKQTLDNTVAVFNNLEDLLGLDTFKLLFPCILTDRDPCFKPFMAFEVSHNTGEKRTSIYYCDAYKSSQKASVENMNAQIRKFIKKKQSIQHLSQDDIRRINLFIVETRVASLGALSPKEAFIRIYGKEVFDLLFNY